MDFAFNDDQVALRDAVRRFCDTKFPLEQRGKPADIGTELKLWQAMSDLGLLGLPLAPEHGGSGLGPVELMIAAEELGRCLETTPYFSHIVLAAQILQSVSPKEVNHATLSMMARGQTKAALAIYETGQRHHWHRVATTASKPGDAFILNGRKTLVLNAADADTFFVLARSSGAGNDESGLSLFAIPAATPGLEIKSYRTIDDRDVADLMLSNVKLASNSLMGELGQAYSVIKRALRQGDAFLCAETVGVMDALLDQCTEHLRVRQQFGTPLAKFQVLQHRIADMVIALEQLRSMACASAMACEAEQALAGERVGETAAKDKPRASQAEEAQRLVSAARVLSARWGRQAAQWAIQMHGAMGMTDELRLGRYAKRLIALSQLHGDAQHHTQSFIQSTFISNQPS
jgi:alkylation response protein AidB-like acyl-CoA dehydrogenase